MSYEPVNSNGLEWVNLIQMTIISATISKNPLEEMEQPSQLKKKVQNEILWCNLKKDRMTSLRFQLKQFSITVNQVCATTTNAKEAEVEQFNEDLQDFLELTQQKLSFSLQVTGMQKQEIKRYLE